MSGRPPGLTDERVDLGPFSLVVARPASAEALIDERRFDDDEFLPYWAELWPAGVALARYVAELRLDGKRVLELGCGLALPSLAAARCGARVLATDWAQEAVDLVAANAKANGLQLRSTLLRWDTAATALEAFDLVLAADVLYEERNAAPLLRLLDQAVAPRGKALIADPGRRHAAAFFRQARSSGWRIQEHEAEDLPSGGIARLSR